MWRSKWTDEDGGMLIQALILMTFVSLMVVTYAGVLHQAQQTTLQHYYQRQAAYNAFTGVEYAIKAILTRSSSNWQETLQIDSDSQVRLSVARNATGQVTIHATGLERGAVFQLKATLELVDLSRFAVLTSGSVNGVRVENNTGISAAFTRIPNTNSHWMKTPVLPVMDFEQFSRTQNRPLNLLTSAARENQSHAKDDDEHDDKEDDDDEDEPDDTDDDEGTGVSGQRFRIVFEAGDRRNPRIMARFIKIKRAPRGSARNIPYILYLPERRSLLEIEASQRITFTGLVIVNGNIRKRTGARFKNGELVIRFNPGVIQQLYRKYSVNQAPYLVRNLKIYAI